MWWDYRCNVTGNELCGLVDEGTPNSIPIPVATVDTFAASGAVKAIDILKIDAEGYDPAVLKGAEQVLQAGKAAVVTFEHNKGMGLWKTQHVHDITTRLDSFGYDCYFESSLKKWVPISESDTPSLYLITGGCMTMPSLDSIG